MQDVANRFASYLLDRIRIDTRTLAVFRIVAGILIIADVLIRSRTFSFLYTEDGVVPRSLAMASTPDHAFSFFYFTTSTWAIAGLFIINIIVAIALMIGYKTRLATILAFLFVVSLDHHNPFVLSHADTLFRFLMFWAMFLPLGERWSIDSLQATEPRRASVANLASAAILLQMLYMYLANGYHKTQSALWTTGEATPLIFGLDDTTYLLGDFMRNFLPLLELGGWAWYYMMLLSWVLLFAPGRLRTLLAFLYIGAHASFAITVRIGAFPYVAISGVLLFLQAAFWSDLRRVLDLTHTPRRYVERFQAWIEHAGSRVAATLPRLQFEFKPMRTLSEPIFDMSITIAVAIVLVLPGISFLANTDLIDDYPKEAFAYVDDLAAVIGVRQAQWTVFAPNPRTTDRYYVFPAETANGELVDVYNDRPLSFDRPYPQLNQQYFTYRERFFMNSVRRSGSGGELAALVGDYYCRKWSEQHGVELLYLNMYVISERVTRDTIADPTGRETTSSRFFMHGCGDNEPQPIEIAED